MGPHPFPVIVRDFQKVIGEEIREQCMEKEGRLPDAVVACVGGGSNAIGTFYDFIREPSVRLIGCEAAGRGVDTFENGGDCGNGPGRYFPRHEIPVSARTNTVRSRRCIPSPRAWIIPESARSTPIFMQQAGRNMCR